MYPRELIKLIAQKADLISLVEQVVSLKKTGKSYIGLCPFHNEKTPSFHVDPIKNFFHCFGCGAHGDSIKFLIDNNNFTFIEAIEKLSSMQGITLKKQAKKNYHPVRQYLEKAKDFFIVELNNLESNSPVAKYLASRNFNIQTIEKFEIGCAPNKWNGLLNKFNLEINGLEKAGLVSKSEKTNHYYDFFRNRIIFPFRDLQGALIGFAGRAVSAETVPKYLNSPELEIFQKSSFFYGIFQAKPAIQKKRRIIIVEGYTDVMRMAEMGFEETVAIAGTSITDKHIRQINQKAVEAIFLFDGDLAGSKSAEKSARLSIKEGINAKVAFLPEGSDPDEFLLKNSAKVLEQKLQQAISVMFFIIQQAKNKFDEADSLNQKDVILKELLEIVFSITEKNKQNIFLSEIAKYFNLDPTKILKNYNLAKVSNSNQSQPKTFIEDTFVKKINLKEAALIGFVFHKPTYFFVLREHLDSSDFLSRDLEKLMARVFSIELEDILNYSLVDFLQFFRDDEKIVKSILFCSNQDSRKIELTFYQELYEIKKKSLYKKFNQASSYLSNLEQKKLWLTYKEKLDILKDLVKISKNERIFFKGTLLKTK